MTEKRLEDIWISITNRINKDFDHSFVQLIKCRGLEAKPKQFIFKIDIYYDRLEYYEYSGKGAASFEKHTKTYKLNNVNYLVNPIKTIKKTAKNFEDFFKTLKENPKDIDQFSKQIPIIHNILLELNEDIGLLADTITYIRKVCLASGKTFALPSHPLMLPFISLFAGKTNKFPRQLLLKPFSERTQKEQIEVDTFLNSIFSNKTRYNENGAEEKDLYALVSNNPRVEASARIDTNLFYKDPFFRQETLGLYIKRSFGAEGLRHLMGILIGLEENYRNGYFVWEVNEHLERLGFKRKKGGAFSSDLKKSACEIVKIFSSLIITAYEKKGKREKIKGQKLFSVDGFEAESFDGEIIKESLNIRALDWYGKAFDKGEKNGRQYTKLLKKVVQENHRNRFLTIYLTPLLAIFWRINPERKFRVINLMKWCDLDHKTQKEGGDYKRLSRLRDLEAELDYMKKMKYLGDWKNNDIHPHPSDCEDPFNCVLTLTPPKWLGDEIKSIKAKREQYLQKKQTQNNVLEIDPVISSIEFRKLIEESNLTYQQIGNKLGVSKQMASLMARGKRKITSEKSDRIREIFNL
jgi:hypothetical protein